MSSTTSGAVSDALQSTMADELRALAPEAAEVSDADSSAAQDPDDSADPMRETPPSQPTRERPARRATRARPSARLAFARCSVASDLHPERNEDALLTDQRRGLAGVFDGVGGSVAGEVAARLAARITRNGWRRLHDHAETARATAQTSAGVASTGPDTGAALTEILLRAHQAICALTLPDAPGDERRDSGAESAATTAAVAVIHRIPGQRGQHVTCAWAGDSRVYLLRARGHLARLTYDDGLLTRLVLDGVVSEHDAWRVDQAVSSQQLTDLGQSLFNRRNGITQSLGGPRAPDIHVSQVALRPGDRVLLCTDGIHDNLTDAELEMVLGRAPRTTVAKVLVACARARSHDDGTLCMRAKPDDMTAVVMTYLPRKTAAARKRN